MPDISDGPIYGYAPPVYHNGEVDIQWYSTAPPGSIYQVYVSRRLIWHGIRTRITLASPIGIIRERVDVVQCLTGDGSTDFSAELPPAPLDRAELQWTGGTFESRDLVGFHVYGSAVPNGPIVYGTVPLANVAGYTPVITDGYGMGGFGGGGFGASSASYAWTSNPLTSGIWSFAVAPYDTAGNIGEHIEGSVLIVAPPLPPARDVLQRRLEYSYAQSMRDVTLTWLASPSALG